MFDGKLVFGDFFSVKFYTLTISVVTKRDMHDVYTIFAFGNYSEFAFRKLRKLN